MKFEKTMDQARQLIGARRFADGLKVCESLIQAHTDEAEACVLAAACQLCLGCPQKDAKKLEKIRKAVARAFAAAESAEAAQETARRLLSAMSRYRGEQMEESLRRQKERAALPELKAYFDTGLRYEDLPALISDAAEARLSELGEAAPAEKEEESPEEELNRRLGQQEFELSRSIFGETRMTVQFHGTGTGKAVSDLLRRSIEMLTVAQILAARSAMAPCDDAERCTRLETEAEILHWGLSTTVHPDGQELSLFCSGREEMLEKLRELYPQIQTLKPDFRAPALPLAIPVNTVPQKPQKPRKGGFFGKSR